MDGCISLPVVVLALCLKVEGWWREGKRERKARKCGLFSAAFFSSCRLLHHHHHHRDNGEQGNGVCVCACVDDELLRKERLKNRRDNAIQCAPASGKLSNGLIDQPPKMNGRKQGRLLRNGRFCLFFFSSFRSLPDWLTVPVCSSVPHA